MKLILLLLIFTVTINVNALTCIASQKKNDNVYKIQLRVKNKNNVDLVLFQNGVEIERCKGESQNVFSKKSMITRSHFIYWELMCDKFRETELSLSNQGKLKFQEDKNSKGTLIYSEYEESILCQFSENKLSNIQKLK